jgi:hypothetical protein
MEWTHYHTNPAALQELVEFTDLFTFPHTIAHVNPKILWYPSGELDFLPLGYYSRKFRQRFQDHIGHIEEPELFVYTCLGPGLPKTIQYYFFRKRILLDNSDFLIEVVHARRHHINRHFYKYQIDPDYIDFVELGLDPLTSIGFDAIFAKVRVTQKHDRKFEEFDLLYLLAENINFLEEVVRKRLVKVLHLCTIREGTGFGGCRRSVIEHAFEINNYHRGLLNPQTIISFSDFTLDIIRRRLVFEYARLPEQRQERYFRDDTPRDAFTIGEGVVLDMLWR